MRGSSKNEDSHDNTDLITERVRRDVGEAPETLKQPASVLGRESLPGARGTFRIRPLGTTGPITDENADFVIDAVGPVDQAENPEVTD